MFLGKLPQDCIASLYSISDLFILNSSYEGLPHVLLESLSYGVTTISTNAGGSSEVIEHNINGILVPVGNYEALKSSVAWALNPVNKDCFTEGMKATISNKFDELICYQNYLKAFESL